MAPPVEPTLDGRVLALDVVAAALDRAADEHRGSIVLLTGEPGIGKSWLLDRIGERAAPVATVGRGGALEGGWQPPFTVWRDALGWEPTDAGADLAPEEAVFRRAALTRDELRRRAAAGPVLVLLDDLHWADDDSLTLLALLAQTLDDLPVVLVGAHRPASELLTPRLADVRATISRQEPFVEITLQGLSVGQLRQLLADAGAPSLAERAETIWADTGGNPLFAREFARDAAASAAVTESMSGPVARAIDADDTVPIGVPARVRELVRHRVRHMSADAQQLLPRVALLPDGASFAVLAAISGLDDDALTAVCDEAIAAGILRADGPSFSFEHAVLRHALADDFNPARIAQRHREIAHALRTSFGEAAPQHAAALAFHLWCASRVPSAGSGTAPDDPGADADDLVGLVAEGVRFCGIAAEAARAEGGFQQAARFRRMAVEIIERHHPVLRTGAEPATTADVAATEALRPLLEDLAIAEASALQFDTALDTVHRAAALHRLDEPAPSLAPFLYRAARALRDAGAPPARWVPLTEEGLARHAAADDLEWARLTLLREPVEPVHHGSIHVGRWTGLDPRAVAIGRAQGDESDLPLVVQPYEWLSRAEVDALVHDARLWRHPTARSHGLNVAARVCCFRFGDMAHAAALHDESAANARRGGALAGEVDALAQRAFCLALTGDLPTGEAALERPQLLADRLGPSHRVRFVVEVLAASAVAHVRGDGPFRLWADAARGAVTDPVAGANVTAPTLAAFAAWAYAMAGDAPAAAAVMADIIPIFETFPVRDYTLNGGTVVLGRAAWELQDPTHAAALLAIAQRLLDAGIDESAFGPVAATAAALASLVGDDRAALHLFADARAALALQDRPPLGALLSFDELRAERRAGREPVAARIDEVGAAFDRLSMTGWRARLDRWRGGDAPAASARAASPPAGLSPREVEVLRLLAAGGSNKEIAGDLYLSPATVQRHVANIYLKIEVRNRAEATSYAHRHGLA